MTDQGHGYGTPPWGADDPLYGGDPYGAQGQGYSQQPQHPQYPQQPGQGWQQAHPQHYGAPGNGGYQDPYAGQHPQQPQHPPQYPYGGGPQQPQQGGWPQQDPYQQQHYPGQGGQGYPQQPPQGYEQHGQPYPDGRYPQQGAPRQPAPQQGWNDAYGHPQQPPHQQPAQEPEPYPAGPDEQEPEPDQGFALETEDRPEAVDDSGSGESFFSEPDESEEAAARRDKKAGKSKRRNGCACLVIALVLVGGVAGGGYCAYNFYQSRYGPPPDYTGNGTGSVQVEIKQGDTLTDMGNRLVDDGVVKSTRAFVKAAEDKGATSVQPGLYTLHHRMSAAAALAALANLANSKAVIVPEGMRAVQVYSRIDTVLHLAPGTTAKVAKADAGQLGLPSYAKGNPEGFLFPTRYNVGAGTKPLDLLKQMVAQAESEYANLGIAHPPAASGLGNPYDVLVEASIVQAEGADSADFGKIARVLYNRLHTNATNGKLEMDSTINYALNRSTLITTSADQQTDSPYNTYKYKGLPPGPIGNPGAAAIQAVLNPTPGDWVFFVTVKPGDTRFTDSYAVQQQNVAAFNAYQKEHGS